MHAPKHRRPKTNKQKNKHKNKHSNKTETAQQSEYSEPETEHQAGLDNKGYKPTKPKSMIDSESFGKSSLSFFAI